LQRKVAVVLLLIVLLPIGLLSWLGLRMAHNEQQVATAQVQALVQSQLLGVDDALNGYFRALQDDWLAHLQQRTLDTEALKTLPQELGLVQQVLVIGADAKRVFPPPGISLSEADKQFLQRTAAIWDNPSLLTQGAALPVLALGNTSLVSKRYLAEVSRANGTGADTSSAEAGPPQSGWYSWHWNAELHHIFWLRDTQGRLIGLELSPVALLADLIARLPATNPLDTTQANTHTRLVNGNGQIVYEWGSYRPAEHEKSLAMRPLSHPLGTWKLEFFGPTLAAASAVNLWGVAAALLGLAAALVGLAWYLYREHSREVRLAQQRVNFVNQVSHELKTPLTNIRLYAELLENELEFNADDSPAGAIQTDVDIFPLPAREGVDLAAHQFEPHPSPAGKAQKYLGIITAESQRLSRLIANVLRFAQFQKAQFTLALQPGRVDDVVQHCVDAFQPALAAKSITVQLQAHAGGLVMLDAQALEQILNNLLSNAEKYAASGGAVHIETSQANGISTIDVRDFGPGIAPRERERVFEPFYRISSRLSDGVAGTGMGLDIARQLARQHGGDVTLSDVASGTCFRVTLRTECVEPSI
jgi:signal transduction histidine kinase